MDLRGQLSVILAGSLGRPLPTPNPHFYGTLDSDRYKTEQGRWSCMRYSNGEKAWNTNERFLATPPSVAKKGI